MLPTPLQTPAEVFSCTRGLLWSKFSLNICTVMYFSEIMWFREHIEATTYTITHTDGHVCVLSCTTKLHVMKCVQQSIGCISPHKISFRKERISTEINLISCDRRCIQTREQHIEYSAMLLLSYSSTSSPLGGQAQISNLCLFLYHRVSRLFMSVSVCSATGGNHLTTL
jgi:hypothetical protein